MSTVKEIESAVERLDNDSLGKFSDWFEDYMAEKWESRFAADVKAGKLDKLGDVADRAFEQGHDGSCIPESFKKGMADAKAGRFANMETVLNGAPPALRHRK